MTEVVRHGARADSDIPTVKDQYARARLAHDLEWPARVWYFLNELFYVMEEHSGDPRVLAAQGGLDDERLRAAMASLVPVLDELGEQMRSDEEGRAAPPVTATDRARAAATELVETMRAFVSGEIDSRDFTSGFHRARSAALHDFPPRVRASVEIVHRAVGAFTRGQRPPRFHDLDEDGLRSRVADAVPRLAEAVDDLSSAR